MHKPFGFIIEPFKNSKKIKVIIFVTALFNSLIACTPKSDDTAGRLRKFYYNYIVANAGPPDSVTQKNNDDTIKKYCTISFFKRIRSDSNLDYDPIVYTQDFDTDWAKTLQVTKLGGGKQVKYNVSYWYNYEHKYDSIQVFMVKENGEMKIDKTCSGGDCN